MVVGLRLVRWLVRWLCVRRRLVLVLALGVVVMVVMRALVLAFGVVVMVVTDVGRLFYLSAAIHSRVTWWLG